MNNPTPQHNTSNFDTVFTQLNQQDIEEFYNGYQYWSHQKQIEGLQTRLDDLRKQCIANATLMQEVQPTAIELATLARLQSNSVSDVDLLDRMLEQGESWLDRTMQRLDYLEQLDDFIQDDYTQWCRHALEGAYDWIDSVLDGNPTSLPPTIPIEDTELTEATEALFLQKISNDKDEDESAMLETTLKRPSITIADFNDSVHSTEETPGTVEDATTLRLTKSVPEEDHTVNSISATDLHTEEIEAVQITEKVSPVELNHTTYNTSVETSVTHENMTLDASQDANAPIIEEPSSPILKPSRANATSKRPNFIRRFLGKFWSS
jgi:hypothetical protein